MHIAGHKLIATPYPSMNSVWIDVEDTDLSFVHHTDSGLILAYAGFGAATVIDPRIIGVILRLTRETLHPVTCPQCGSDYEIMPFAEVDQTRALSPIFVYAPDLNWCPCGAIFGDEVVAAPGLCACGGCSQWNITCSED